MSSFGLMLAVVEEEQRGGWWDQLQGFGDLFILLGAVALIALMIWFVRGAAKGNSGGFVIYVDEEDITFSGPFPAHMRPTVIEFLRHDVGLPGSYEVRGRWEERVLVVVVKGEQARGMEQRIRNFLKLNLKPPRE